MEKDIVDLIISINQTNGFVNPNASGDTQLAYKLHSKELLNELTEEVSQFHVSLEDL